MPNGNVTAKRKLDEFYTVNVILDFPKRDFGRERPLARLYAESNELGCISPSSSTTDSCYWHYYALVPKGDDDRLAQFCTNAVKNVKKYSDRLDCTSVVAMLNGSPFYISIASNFEDCKKIMGLSRARKLVDLLCR